MELPLQNGTETQLNTRKDGGGSISTIMLSNNKIFISYSAGIIDYLYAMICTINNTTITVQSDVELCAERYAGYVISTTKVSDNKILITHSYDDNYYLNAMMCVIDNTEITADTDIRLSTAVRSGYGISTVLMLSNKAMIAHNYSNIDNSLCAMLCDTTEMVGIEKLASSSDKILGITKKKGIKGEIVKVVKPKTCQYLLTEDSDTIVDHNNNKIIIE